MATYLDTETCGLHGPIVLIQYAVDDGPVEMWSPWTKPIIETLKVIEQIVFDPEGVVGFNLAFDWFHLCQMYTTLLLMDDSDADLGDCIEEYALKEAKGRDGPCLKPVSALDLMIYARKGPYQSTMDRKDIKIRKVPNCLAYELAKELESRVQLKDIYFARRKNKTADKWKVLDCIDKDGKIHKDFKNVVLKFHPTSALKALAIDALGLDPNETLIYEKVSLPSKAYPNEKRRGYAPYATAFGEPGNWNGTWPDFIRHHIDHWTYNSLARQYAELDVVYLQKLRKHFGNPPLGDDDSILACMVGAVRWRGYAIDIPKMRDLLDKAIATSKAAPTVPAKVKWWVNNALDKTEQVALKGSTSKVVLEDLADNPEYRRDCDNCKTEGCEKCNKKGWVPHPAAVRAKACLDARKAKYRIGTLEKFLRAGKFHASFVVVGAKSGRMAGVDDLNAQGIDRTTEMRECFPLADRGLVLCGGDFSSFEVNLADAVYDDPDLRRDLQRDVKIHAIFAMELYPSLTYEEVLASKGSKVKDYYDAGKRGVFAILYGGDENTLKTKIGIDLEIGKQAVDNFIKKKYKRVGIVQAATRDKFCSMRQPGGLGTKVIWIDPADYVEAKTGFRRHFTLENSICKALYMLANNPPKHWKQFKVKVNRRDDRFQFADGATQSALYGAAFQLQAANMRAAVNHEIQSFGALLAKRLQRKIWDLQKPGISSWSVQPMNVHDEILVPAKPDFVPLVRMVVEMFLEETRPLVPLIGIDWHDKMETWAEK